MDISSIHQRDPYAIAQNAQSARAEARVENRTDARVDGRQPQGPASANATGSDRVSVSEEGVLRTEAYRAAMNAPELRQEKVNAIKASIADGSYRIDSQRIAASLVSQEKALLA